jgi:transcriptional regulator with XRE-family HTH domain
VSAQVDQPGTDDDVLAGIAASVRAKRLAAGLSMRALAAKAGMSQPFLSNLENGRAMPSIATLYKIAAALGVSARDFLAADEPATISVVRAGEGPLSPVGDEPTSTRSRLVAGGPGRVLEAHVFDVGEGETLGSWFEHDGEDLLAIHEGRLLVEFTDGQRHELGPGDTLWHVSTIAHRWLVLEAPVRLLLVNAHPGPVTAHRG